MTTTFKFAHTAMLTVPLALAASMASAGGLAAPVETVAPTPVAAAPAPVVRGADWTGFYAGGQLGYGKLTSPFLTELEQFAAEDGIDLDASIDGAVYGIHAGYMYDLGSIVLGGEFDYDLTNMDLKFEELTFIDVDSIMRLKLRVGYDAGQFLPYVTGGVVRANVSGDGEGEGEGFSDNFDGDFYGLGVAYKFSDRILIGGEVLQHKFYESKEDEISGFGFRATTATARVSYQF